MKCSNCGNEIKDGELFCPLCGTKVETETKIEEVEGKEKAKEEIKETKHDTISTENTANNVQENTAKKNNNPNIVPIIIGIIVLAVVFGLSRWIGQTFISPSIKNSISNSLSQKSEISNTSPNTNLDSVTINEKAFPPEATVSYTHEKLSFKLPSKYSKNPSSSTEMYIIDWEDDEAFAVGIASFESKENVDVKSYLESLDDSKFQTSGYTVTSSKPVKSESINGVTWYVKTLKQKNSVQEIYEELYYTLYKGKLYYIGFEIDARNGKTADESRSNQFFNIKNSLKFN